MFVAAAFFEIAGCFSFWLWLRQARPWWVIVPGVLSLAIFAWFVFVLLYDGAALSLAGWITGSRGGRVLFASVFGNPVDLIRIAALSVSGTPSVLGAAGDAWVRYLGGTAGAAIATTAGLFAWLTAPLLVGMRLIRGRDL